MSDLKDSYSDYAFHFLNDVEKPAIRLIAVGKQTRTSSKYHWDNKNRRECYLFQYTLNGSVTIEIDSQKYIADKGKGFFIKIPGNSCYYFDENDNTAPYEHIYLMFNCSETSYFDYIEKHLGNVFSIDLYSPAIQILQDIYSKAENKAISNPFWLSSRLFEFLCLLCSQNFNKENNDLGIIGRAKEYLNNHYTDQIGIKNTADYLQVSPSHLSREFYKKLGEKPVEYLTRLRLKKAIDLLSTTALKIEDISSKCGFSSSNYFNKVFKKHMNMTPNQFRLYVNNEVFSTMQI